MQAPADHPKPPGTAVETPESLPATIPELRAQLLEERRLRQRLESCYDELRGLEDLKSSFNALACHEIRGALCVIAGFLDMASEDLLDDLQETTRELLMGAGQQMDRITSLLQQLGDFGQMQPAHAGAAARATLDQILAHLAPSLAAQFGPVGFDMQVDIEPESAGCMLYADLTGLALRALVGNFRRLGTGPVRVQIRSRRIDARLQIEVSRPDGEFVPELHAEILEKAAPGGPPPDPHSGGLALGLWIAWRAAAALHGELVMHSGDGGSGVRFTLRVPLDADQ